MRVGLPDGNGCFGSISFWNDYFQLIGVDYVSNDDEQYKLEKYVSMSNKVFPSSICVNSKYRLGRALEMEHKVDCFLMFLRDDIVSNCIASIYRTEWIKDYFQNITCIVWKRDLCPKEDDTANLIYLSELLTGNRNEEAIKKMVIPTRRVIYDMSLGSNNPEKPTLMLIGVAPFFVDLYRKSELMDYIVSKFNVISPKALATNSIKEDKYKLYRENSIMNSIALAEEEGLVDGYLFAGDAFDFPGKYTFPKLKRYIKKLSNKPIFELTPGIKNQMYCKNYVDEIYGIINSK